MLAPVGTKLTEGLNYMATGTVKWFNGAKGFGFIQPDEGGPDVFVHISAVERAGLAALNEGQKITYELEKDPRSGKTAAGQLQAGRKEPPSGQAPRFWEGPASRRRFVMIGPSDSSAR